MISSCVTPASPGQGFFGLPRRLSCQSASSGAFIKVPIIALGNSDHIRRATGGRSVIEDIPYFSSLLEEDTQEEEDTAVDSNTGRFNYATRPGRRTIQ